MHFYIFGNFREPSRLPNLRTVVSDTVVPRSENDREVLETTVKLFYEPGEDFDPVIREMINRGFTIVERNPYTLMSSSRQKYKRSLKVTLSPEEFISKRGLYPDLEVVFNNDRFEIYENLPDGFERLETKNYYNDRVIFRL